MAVPPTARARLRCTHRRRSRQLGGRSYGAEGATQGACAFVASPPLKVKAREAGTTGTPVAPVGTMNVLEAIQARRAVRSYTPRRVEEEIVRSLLRAAVQAPSAMNAQPWLFAVVQDESRLKRYSDGAKALLVEQAGSDTKARHYADRLSDASFNIFYDASTLVAIGVGERSTYSEADCWLAAQNLMLAARDAGLATCPIGFAVPILNTPSVRQELEFPSAGVVIAPIIVGYPSTWPPAVPRREPRILSFAR